MGERERLLQNMVLQFLLRNAEIQGLFESLEAPFNRQPFYLSLFGSICLRPCRKNEELR